MQYSSTPIKKCKVVIAYFLTIFAFAYSNLVQAEDKNPTYQSGPKEWLKVNQTTQVMVLGSAHLNRYTNRLEQEDFEPLIQRLVSFNPQVIAVESIYNASIFNYQHRESYQEVIKHFAATSVLLAETAQQTLQVDASEAIEKVRFAVEDKQYSLAERKKIILTQLAGYNLPTALLHWMKLDKKQKSSSGLPNLVTEALEEASTGLNEINVVAARLALELELSNLYAIDDHSDKDIYSTITAPLSAAFQNKEVKIDHSRLKKFLTLGESYIDNKDVVGWYTQLNSNHAVKESTYQWQAIVDSKVKENANLARISLWELRNAQMVANILRVAALNPGKRILVVVGAGHKAFFDDYLARMTSIEIVQPIDYLSDSKTN